MSGIETVKIIVDAEKEAATMIQNAQERASEIKKGLESRISAERERVLATAKKEAAAIVSRAEEDGKREATSLEKEETEKIRLVVAKASANKRLAADKLVSIVLEGKE